MALKGLAGRWNGGADVETGMLLMTLAMILLPGIDAVSKLLTATLAPGQVAWGRFAFQTGLLLPLMWLMRQPMRSRQIGTHACRGALIAIAIVLFVWALKYLPIANAVAIFFVEPLILTVFSAVFLGEALGRRRVLAVIAGLLGALIVIRPNWSAFGPAAVLPLGTAVCFAGYLTLTRHMGATENAMSLQLWSGMFAGLFLTIALVFGTGAEIPVLTAAWPDARELLLFVALGIIATLGHVLIAQAFRRAPAGVLAPFQYLEILSATLLGVLLFADWPDAGTWLGTVVIVAAGLYVYTGERRAGQDALPDRPERPR